MVRFLELFTVTDTKFLKPNKLKQQLACLHFPVSHFLCCFLGFTGYDSRGSHNLFMVTMSHIVGRIFCKFPLM